MKSREQARQSIAALARASALLALLITTRLAHAQIVHVFICIAKSSVYIAYSHCSAWVHKPTAWLHCYCYLHACMQSSMVNSYIQSAWGAAITTEASARWCFLFITVMFQKISWTPQETIAWTEMRRIALSVWLKRSCKHIWRHIKWIIEQYVFFLWRYLTGKHVNRHSLVTHTNKHDRMHNPCAYMHRVI